MARPLTGLVTQITAQSAINTLGLLPHGSDVGVFADLTMVYAVFGAGTSAGAVLVETAHDPNYAGTWALLATITWSAASKVGTALVTGQWQALRVRIGTGIVGGTVDVYTQISKGS